MEILLGIIAVLLLFSNIRLEKKLNKMKLITDFMIRSIEANCDLYTQEKIDKYFHDMKEIYNKKYGNDL
jgi:hypothetical protein